jgi:sporulation protein YlmC with PRC-barrel domain
MGTAKKFRRTLAASTLDGDHVVDRNGNDCGKVESIMIDVQTGRVAYVVLSFGGLLGMGNKLFALPWSAVQVDEANKRFIVNLTKEQLELAPGFDKDNWPDLGDESYASGIYRHYNATPYWTA